MQYRKNSFIVVPNQEYLTGKPSEIQSIFMWLCFFSDENGISFPTRKTLAEKAGVNLKTLDKYIVLMQEMNLISVKPRKKENSKENTSNLYQVNILEPIEDLIAGIRSGERIEGLVIPKTVQRGPKNGTTGGPKNGSETQSISNINIPNSIWLDKKVWGEWEQYRKEIKKTLTQSSVNKQIAFLEQHKKDHVKIIERSIANGWTGLFPIGGNKNDVSDKAKAFDKRINDEEERKYRAENQKENDRLREINDMSRTLFNQFKA